MRQFVLTTAFVLLALVFATAALTKTVIGTAGSDNLRGTPGADVISGKGGNDTLRGLRGNDRLLGGPGNDRLSGDAGNDVIAAGPGNDTIATGPGSDRVVCGGGVDRVNGDLDDTAAADCENVSGLTPPALAPEGHYAAVGDWLAFDVAAGGRTITGLRVVRLLIPCASGLRLSLPVAVPDVITINDDHTFTHEYSSTEGFKPTLNISGRFDGSNASGTVRLRASFAGTTCDGSAPWTASHT